MSAVGHRKPVGVKKCTQLRPRSMARLLLRVTGG
jgi:hypothetical protein